MAKIDKSTVLHVAELAQLNLTESEVKKFSDQLSTIVDFVDQLSEVDVKGLEPTSQTTGLENVYRDDLINPKVNLSVDKALSGSDKTHNDYFVVDAILTGRTDK